MAQVYAIDGVEIPASLLRAGQYDGAEGVKAPGHLRVAPLSVPGAGVTVAPGVADVISRYPGAPLEAYTVRETSQQTVSVTATGSGSGRNDLVVARVWDGNLETLTGGQESGAGFTIIQGVAASVIASPTAALAYCQTLTYPALPLAGLVIPASTGTVTAAMIRDLRTLARPRSQRVMDFFSNGAKTISGVGSANAAQLTIVQTQVTVPLWATHVRILGTVLDLIAAAPTTGNVTGVLEVRFAGAAGADTNIDVNITDKGSDRVTVAVGHEQDVTSLRGTTQALQIWGWVTGSGDTLSTTASVQIMWDVFFTEETV